MFGLEIDLMLGGDQMKSFCSGEEEQFSAVMREVEVQPAPPQETSHRSMSYELHTTRVRVSRERRIC